MLPVRAGHAARATIHVDELALAWRQRAEDLRRYGALPSAVPFDVAADELEAALHAAEDALLTLEQAAHESGFSADHLGREVRESRIPNAGRPGAPRIRRADLPRKAARVATPATTSYDPVADAEFLLAGRLHESRGGAHGK